MTAIGRLKTRVEFLHVRDGTRFAAPSLVLQARARLPESKEAANIARFGFTASKALGNAALSQSASALAAGASEDLRKWIAIAAKDLAE